jgi:hypothetical protein
MKQASRDEAFLRGFNMFVGVLVKRNKQPCFTALVLAVDGWENLDQ